MSASDAGGGMTPGRPKRPPRQVDRVAKAGLAAGDRGICQADFLAPNVVDGRGQITRLASRVSELRDRGYVIRTAGRRRGFRVYIFVSAPRSPAPSSPTAPELFTRAIGAPPPRGPYDEGEAA